VRLVDTTVSKHGNAKRHRTDISDNERPRVNGDFASHDTLMNSSNLVVMMIDSGVEILPTTAALALMPYSKTFPGSCRCVSIQEDHCTASASVSRSRPRTPRILSTRTQPL
jgi:hypothetical protein